MGGRMTRKTLAVTVLAAAIGTGGIAATAASATPVHPVRGHHHAKRKPHRQALKGSPKAAHVKVVKVLIRGGKGGGIDPGDDYPGRWKNRPQDSVLDQWREYNRECTSFVAWALYSRN